MSGLFGVITEQPCATDLFYGTDYHSHLGTRRAGLSTIDNGVMHLNIHNIENTQFKTKFSSDIHEMLGHKGIGVISDTDAQPIVCNSHLGRFAVCTVSRINNIDELEQLCLSKNQQFTELTIGRRSNDYAVASESHSYANLGFTTQYHVQAGEAVLITPSGIQQLIPPSDKMQICSFLWIYYGFPCVEYEDINAEEVRYRLGEAMGKNDDVDADYVSGIPDSGVGMALGYAVGRGIPYKRGILKYTPTWARSFMPVNQEARNLVAKMKLIPSRKVLEGKEVVFCDDSIVRGTQLRDQTRMLYANGVKRIHIRISCPPLLYGCNYLNFSTSKTDRELITRRVIEQLEGGEIRNLEAYRDETSKQYATMVETIRKTIGVDTLKFNSLDTLCQAVGLPKCQLCTHCFDGSSFGE